MKNILVAIASLFLLTTIGRAQMDSSGVERRVERLKADLALTADQTAKVRTILFESRQEGMKMREANPEDRDAMRQAFAAQREKTDKRIEALLTAEQKVKYQKIREERRQMMRQGPPRN